MSWTEENRINLSNISEKLNALLCLDRDGTDDNLATTVREKADPGIPAVAPEEQDEWLATMEDEDRQRSYDPHDHEPGPWSEPDGYIPLSERDEL